MRRVAGMVGAALLGGLLVAMVMMVVRIPARAARATSTSAQPLDVVINEVAWGGHAGYTADEWIELYNNTDQPICLEGWRLCAADGPPDLALSGCIPPHGAYLIERSDDQTVSDVPADWSGSFGTGLSNGGETLLLEDDRGVTIDTANGGGGAWPAGSAVPAYCSMERVDPTVPDSDANWTSNDGVTRNGLDAGGNPINGTPKAPNSCYQPPTGDDADLVVAKSGPSVAAPGERITYCVTLGNAGSLTATDVRVTDTLPAGVDWLGQSGPFPFERRGHELTWQAGDVPPDALYAITVTARVSESSSGPVTNWITATSTAGEPLTANNSAGWTTAILPSIRLYALAPANYWGSGEAAALVNLGSHAVSLDGWRLNGDPNPEGGLAFPASATIDPGQVLWLAQDGDGFTQAWGFDADWAAQATARPVPGLEGDWPIGLFADAGDAAYLLDAAGNVADALAYGAGSASQGWIGRAVPYPYAGYGNGQVIYRKLHQVTGLPVADTDTAADWAQDPDDPIDGRKLRYPGWDLEDLFFPVEITATTHLTLAVAPEGTLDVVSHTIGSARHSLRIEAYTLESVPLYRAISDRIRSGVVVTVVLDSGPAGGMEDAERWIAQRLHHPPTSAVYFMGQTAPRYRFQHAKFILVDDRLAVVSSDNYGENSMPSDRKDNGTMGHRGFVAVTDSADAVARLAEIFRRDCDPVHHRDVAPCDATYAPPGDFFPLPSPDWTTYTAPFSLPLVTTASHVTLLHAPEHALRDSDGLLGLVGRAGQGDEIAVLQMNEPFTWTAGAGPAGLNPRLQALVGAARAGARVRVLLDEYYDNPMVADSNTVACLRINRIAAREGFSLTCHLANVTGLGIHAKAFLVSAGGEGWVHLGSINGSENSSKKNREVALQFRSAQAYAWMQAIFEHDWARSHPPMVYRTHFPLAMRDRASPARYPLITEVLVNPSDDDTGREWIEVYNPGPEVAIGGWTLGDAIHMKDYGDGRVAFPTGTHLLRGQVIVAAACATDFCAAYGFNPTCEWVDCDAAVPDMTPVAHWEGFGIALGNTKDEVLLMDAGGGLVDSAAWGGKSRAGVMPFIDFEPPFPRGSSLKRYPPDNDRDECGRDFYVSYYPSPGLVAGTIKNDK